MPDHIIVVAKVSTISILAGNVYEWHPYHDEMYEQRLPVDISPAESIKGAFSWLTI